MRGVIVEGEVMNATGEPERVLVFLELEDTASEYGLVLHARRSYGERASILTLELDAVETALAALKREAARVPEVTLEVDDDAEGEP